MVESTNYAALGLSGCTQDVTSVLEQASSSLPCGRPHRPARTILRPSSTYPVDSTI
jgi:hypothetical protein